MGETRKRKSGGALLKVFGLEGKVAGRTVFRDISLEVRPGEIVGLVGPPGAGKTSFIDCLNGLVEPTAGEIMFAGRSLAGRVSPATTRVIRLAGQLFALLSLLWLPLVLGVVCPNAWFPLETGAAFGLLALARLLLVCFLVRLRPWSRLLLLLFAAVDTVCGMAWLWQSSRFAEVTFFGLFPFYPLLVPGALILLMISPVLLFLFNLSRVREALGSRPGPAAVTALGLGRSFAEPRLWPELSVLDNVRLGRYCRARSNLFEILLGLPGARSEERDATEKATASLRFVGLGEQLEKPAGALSHDEQRRLEIARALATEPRLLLLDEPAAGISPLGVKRIAGLLRRISQAGIAILLVEPDMKLVLELADRISVLDRGELVASGSPEQVRQDPRVIEAYFGARHGAAQA